MLTRRLGDTRWRTNTIRMEQTIGSFLIISLTELRNNGRNGSQVCRERCSAQEIVYTNDRYSTSVFHSIRSLFVSFCFGLSWYNSWLFLP